MSQQQLLSVEAGGLPVEVPTQFVVDGFDDFDYNVPASPGNWVSGNHIYQLYGDNGIEVYQKTSEPDVAQVRFSRGTVTTTDDVFTPVINLPIPTNTTLTFQVIVTCRGDNGGSGGGYATATVENTAGTASLVGLNEFVVRNNALLDGIEIKAEVSGANYQVQVKGLPAVSGVTINWGACLPGIVITD